MKYLVLYILILSSFLLRGKILYAQDEGFVRGVLLFHGNIVKRPCNITYTPKNIFLKPINLSTTQLHKNYTSSTQLIIVFSRCSDQKQVRIGFGRREQRDAQHELYFFGQEFKEKNKKIGLDLFIAREISGERETQKIFEPGKMYNIKLSRTSNTASGDIFTFRFGYYRTLEKTPPFSFVLDVPIFIEFP